MSVDAPAVIDAARFRAVVVRYAEVLRAHQEELNRLNVYPVPDGDTGTNMALTVASVVAELENSHDAMDSVCKAVAHGSLMGARGNSGVILSQILRGLADVFGPLASAGVPEVASALRHAADAAYQAVMRPVEGTILTVARVAAERAEAAAAGASDLLALLERVSSAAHEAVANTPDLLPVLKEAGVVDAGGRGFALFVDTFLEVLGGPPVPEPEVVVGGAPVFEDEHGHGHEDTGNLRYEVMYFLEAADDTIPGFRDAWAAIGDSIVVVGGDGIWNCHVHTNDVGAAIEAGVEAGTPRRIRVTDLVEQVEQLEHHEPNWAALQAEAVEEELPHVTTAVVAVAVGDGLRRLFRSLGVQRVIAGGQSMNPSTAQILEAVKACNADSVIVLPNNKNIIPVAEQVDELADVAVSVLPTKSVIEGLAALVAYDPEADAATNLPRLHEAAEHVRTGEITQAVRPSRAECGLITEGDWIGVERDGIHVRATNAIDALTGLVDRLIDDDTEIVTVVVGADAHAGDTRLLEEHVQAEHPHVEVEVHDGGQPLYPFLVGVE